MSCTRSVFWMQFACLLAALYCAMPLAAAEAEEGDDEREWVTNLGRTVLSQADLVTRGVIDTQAKQVGSTYLRKLTVLEDLWGNSPGAVITITYLEPSSFSSKDEHVVVALKASDLAASFSLIGRRESIGEDSNLTTTLKDYIGIEETPATPRDRAVALAATVKRHLKKGGAAARLARVELLLLVANYAHVLNHSYYDDIRALRTEVEEAYREDLDLACQGMVMLTLKTQAIAFAWKGDRSPKLSGRERTPEEVLASRLVAVEQLAEYLTSYPDAFDAEDENVLAVIADTAPALVATRMAPIMGALQQIVARRPEEAEDDGIVRLRNAANSGSSATIIEEREDATGGAAGRPDQE